MMSATGDQAACPQAIYCSALRPQLSDAQVHAPLGSRNPRSAATSPCTATLAEHSSIQAVTCPGFPAGHLSMQSGVPSKC